MRQRELAATAKAFLLDKPEVSLQELTEHLRVMAEQFLGDDYWNGLQDTQALNKGIRLALEVLTAAQLAQQRVDTGDTSGLINTDDNNHTDYSTIGDSTSILKNEQGDRPAVFTQERQPSVVFSELVPSLLAEKVQTLKSSSYKDLSSSLNTVSRFLPEDMDLMSRSEWLAVRYAMLAAEVRPSTINKLLTKAKMCLDYGLMNGQLEGRNPIERMKLVKNVESKRRAFTDEEMERLLVRVEAEYQFTRHTAHTTSEARRWASLVSVVTGARSAEVCHLTKRDIVTLNNGLVCIDINEDGDGKSVKNKHSVRLVPLTDEACGFDLKSFLEWVDMQPDEGPLFGMTPSAYSSWFNSRVLTEAIPDAENVSLHSLRHWLATRMKERGVNLVDAQGILGHSSQSITYDLYGKGHAVGRLAEVLKTALL
ncbi:TPA: site-specific integrase [Escherichia coli]